MLLVWHAPSTANFQRISWRLNCNILFSFYKAVFENTILKVFLKDILTFSFLSSQLTKLVALALLTGKRNWINSERIKIHINGWHWYEKIISTRIYWQCFFINNPCIKIVVDTRILRKPEYMNNLSPYVKGQRPVFISREQKYYKTFVSCVKNFHKE